MAIKCCKINKSVRDRSKTCTIPAIKCCKIYKSKFNCYKKYSKFILNFYLFEIFYSENHYLKTKVFFKNNMDGKKFLCRKDTEKYFRISKDTLFSWERDGLIDYLRTKPLTGHKRYDVYSYKGIVSTPKQCNTTTPDTNKQKRKICYCRVSTRSQSNDLDRQIESMQKLFPGYTIIKDFGSGINFKRQGLLSLLDGAIEGTIESIVVSHRDRLTRFGFELFEWLFNKHGVSLVVLEQTVGSKEHELCQDMLAIMHVFSCRANGSRRYKKKGETEGGKTEVRNDSSKEEN